MNNENEIVFSSNLKNEMPGTITLMITHRLSLVNWSIHTETVRCRAFKFIFEIYQRIFLVHAYTVPAMFVIHLIFFRSVLRTIECIFLFRFHLFLTYEDISARVPISMKQMALLLLNEAKAPNIYIFFFLEIFRCAQLSRIKKKRGLFNAKKWWNLIHLSIWLIWTVGDCV